MKTLDLIRLGSIVMSALMFVGCSSTPDEDAIYKDSTATQPLEVPPDLIMPVSNHDFAVPGIASQQRTYLGYSGKGKKQPLLPKAHKDIRFIREGNQAWLEVKGKPDALWAELQKFLIRIGYDIKRSERLLGVLETRWFVTKAAESGWFVDTVGQMDKFRVRLEKSKKKNTTLVFVRHRGMRGTIEEMDGQEKTRWLPRPSDSELEVELLSKFMIYRGLSSEQVQHLAIQKELHQNSRLVTGNAGKILLEVDENFDRTWRRVGLALDRMGLVIDDRNRSAGVYYISIPENLELAEEKNWFASLFSLIQGENKAEYLLSVKTAKGKTSVAIKNRKNATTDESVARKILTRIQAHIS